MNSSYTDDVGVMSATRDQQRDVLPLEGEVRRTGSERSAAAEAVGRGEPEAEADRGGPGDGFGDAEGSSRKKMVEPEAKRTAVAELRKQHGTSERRACRLVGLKRSTHRYRQRKNERWERLRTRIGAIAKERQRFRLPAHHGPAAARGLAGESQVRPPHLPRTAVDSAEASA